MKSHFQAALKRPSVFNQTLVRAATQDDLKRLVTLAVWRCVVTRHSLRSSENDDGSIPPTLLEEGAPISLAILALTIQSA
jgi:hypothetical protein